MPVLADYDELDLSVMDIDEVAWRGDRLRANFGAGYGAFAVVGPANGTHRWRLSDGGVTPDRTDAASLPVGSESRFDYYWNFFKEHTTGVQEVFVIEFRGRKYFARFAEPEQSFERFTDDLYSGGVEIVQARVAGFYEGTDGSVFEPSLVADKVWGWYKPTTWAGIISRWVDANGGVDRTLVANGDVDTDGVSQQNGVNLVRLSLNTADGYLNTDQDPTIYEAFFALKCREASFAGYEGLLTADTATAALVGNGSDNKLVNFSFGSSFHYWLDGVLKTEATQLMPMQTFGIVHARWDNGITLANLQVGADRDFGDRFGLFDIGEMLFCDEALTDEEGADMDGYLMYVWDV